MNTETKNPGIKISPGFDHYIARCTFPERRQRVHTYTLLGVPSTIAFTL